MNRWGRALVALASVVVLTATALVAGVSGAGAAAAAGPDPIPPGAWKPAAGTVPHTTNYVYLESQAGDWVGGGQTVLYTKDDSTLGFTPTGSRIDVGVGGNTWWNGTFAGPNTLSKLTTGYYSGLTRYPFNDAAQGGLSWSGDGRGCNTLTGWFIVDDIAYSGTTLTRLTLRFEQHCEGGGPALHGQVHYDAAAPPAFLPNPRSPQGPEHTFVAGTTPATGNYLRIESQPGDWVGGGQNQTYTDITVSGNGVHVSGSQGSAGGWTWNMSGPSGIPQLVPGHYAGLERDPFRNQTVGGIDFSGNGRGCNTILGSFDVDEVQYVNDNLADITMRFEQHCEGGQPALFGILHWHTPAASGTPGEPTHVTAVGASGAADVSWTAPAAGASPITGYRVTPFVDGAAGTPVDFTGTATTAHVGGLTNGSAYSFVVEALNASGAGPRSNQSNRVRPPSAGALLPESLTAISGPVEAPSGRGATLSAKAFPKFGSGAAAGNITLRDGNTVVGTVPATGGDLTICNLAVGDHQVTASYGGSLALDRSTSVSLPIRVYAGGSATAPGPPGRPTAVPGNGSATVSWAAGPDGGCPVSGYVVTPYRNGVAQAAKVYNTADLSHGISGLDNGASYTFTVAAVNTVGTGPASPASIAVTPAQYTASEAFLEAAYADFLHRAPTAGELSFYAGALDGHSTTRASIVGQLAASPEWITGVVNKLYEDTLGRTGDPGGIAYWTGELQSKRRTVAQVAANFYASPEYFTGIGGGTNTSWVTDLYQKLLHRAPDAGGLQYWTSQAVSKGRVSVAIRFFDSLESRQARVTALYQSLLGRAPDVGGRDYWADKVLTSGDLSLAANLAASDEYFARSRTRFA